MQNKTRRKINGKVVAKKKKRGVPCCFANYKLANKEKKRKTQNMFTFRKIH
jgi:hypothetical protein